MKAYVIEQVGGPDVLQLRDIPSVATKADEVRIRVRAFGLNRAEIYRRAGKMGPIAGQVVPGIEAVGEVIEDASGLFRTGQHVATAMGDCSSPATAATPRRSRCYAATSLIWTASAFHGKNLPHCRRAILPYGGSGPLN